MNALDQALDSYLALRRALGFKLETDEKQLRSFVDYLQDNQSSFVTTPMALAWVKGSNHASPATRAGYLSVVRSFARHLHASDPLHEVPPIDLFPRHKMRYQPYIYSDEDVAALLKATRMLRHPFKASTYATFLGLIAVTGMRLGEARALDRSDIDWNNRLLLVRESKFQKSRQLPLHATTVHALRCYADKRDEFFRSPRTQSMFVSLAGTRLLKGNIHISFMKLLRSSGLAQRRPRPRIHDLRHSFAVNTIRRWYEAGIDVEHRLACLSTYLGHVDPSATYWYMTATSDLMALAAKRLEGAMGELP